ncbi:MAG: general secretion pathway protein GspK [Acidisphaera sp.]|nr:general secretion pathway protein GspK [Acidisphaera sp.]
MSRGERGFALLIVLWSLGLLALLGSQLGARARTEGRIAFNLRADAQAEAAADGAVHEAIFHLLEPPGRRWHAGGPAYRLALAHGTAEISISNEGGKINPNLASDAMLRSLIGQVAPAADPATLAAAIEDWRSRPSRTPRPGGATAPQYKAAGRDYGPPGTAFESLDEVGEVLGVTPDILAAMRPHLSIYTQDDPMRSEDPVVARAIAETMADQLDLSAAAVDDSSPVLAITASVLEADGSRFSRRAVVEFVPDVSGRPFRILAWETPGP